MRVIMYTRWGRRGRGDRRGRGGRGQGGRGGGGLAEDGTEVRHGSANGLEVGGGE